MKENESDTIFTDYLNCIRNISKDNNITNTAILVEIDENNLVLVHFVLFNQLTTKYYHLICHQGEQSKPIHGNEMPLNEMFKIDTSDTQSGVPRSLYLIKSLIMRYEFKNQEMMKKIACMLFISNIIVLNLSKEMKKEDIQLLETICDVKERMIKKKHTADKFSFLYIVVHRIPFQNIKATKQREEGKIKKEKVYERIMNLFHLEFFYFTPSMINLNTLSHTYNNSDICPSYLLSLNKMIKEIRDISLLSSPTKGAGMTGTTLFYHIREFLTSVSKSPIEEIDFEELELIALKTLLVIVSETCLKAYNDAMKDYIDGTRAYSLDALVRKHNEVLSSKVASIFLKSVKGFPIEYSPIVGYYITQLTNKLCVIGVKDVIEDEKKIKRAYITGGLLFQHNLLNGEISKNLCSKYVQDTKKKIIKEDEKENPAIETISIILDEFKTVMNEMGPHYFNAYQNLTNHLVDHFCSVNQYEKESIKKHGETKLSESKIEDTRKYMKFSKEVQKTSDIAFSIPISVYLIEYDNILALLERRLLSEKYKFNVSKKEIEEVRSSKIVIMKLSKTVNTQNQKTQNTEGKLNQRSIALSIHETDLPLYIFLKEKKLLPTTLINEGTTIKFIKTAVPELPGSNIDAISNITSFQVYNKKKRSLIVTYSQISSNGKGIGYNSSNSPKIGLVDVDKNQFFNIEICFKYKPGTGSPLNSSFTLMKKMIKPTNVLHDGNVYAKIEFKGSLSEKKNMFSVAHVSIGNISFGVPFLFLSVLDTENK